MKELFGYLSGIFAFLFYLGIIVSIVSGRMKPSRTTWLIWTINDLLILGTSFALGARNTLWAPFAYVISGFICLTLSWKSDRTPRSQVDKLCLEASCASWILWILTNRPLISLALGVTVNTIGAIPTWVKTYRDPRSESLTPWTAVTLCGLFQILSVEQPSLELLLFPIDSFLVSSSILLLCLRRISPSSRILKEKAL